MRKGFHHSLTSRKLISKAGKGRKPWNFGLTKHNDKRVAKYAHTISTLVGEKNPMHGKKRSKQWIAKMKEQYRTNPNMGMRGKKPWNFGLSKKTDKRILLASKKQSGKIRTEKHKKNISKSIKEGFKKGRKTWNKNKHGIYSKEILNKMSIGKRESIKREIEQGRKQIAPGYSKKACVFFNKLNKLYKLNGQHAETKEKEFFVKDLGVWLDFYSKKYNIVIEYNDEKHYDKGHLTLKHLRRQYQIKKLLGCTFINVRERTFKEESIFRKIESVIRQKTIRLVA